MIACVSPAARAIAESAAAETASRRSHLVTCLTDLGLPPVAPAHTPFVLVDTTGWLADSTPGALRGRLRERGFAVRRGETFPGLGADWIRIAVRDEETTDTVIKTLRSIRDES